MKPWNLGIVYCLAILLVCWLWLNFASTYQSLILWKFKWLDNLCLEGQDAGEQSWGVHARPKWVHEKEKRTQDVRYPRSRSDFTHIERNCFCSLSFFLQGPGAYGQESGSLFMGHYVSQKKFDLQGVLEEWALLHAQNELLFVFSSACSAAAGNTGPAVNTISKEYTLRICLLTCCWMGTASSCGTFPTNSLGNDFHRNLFLVGESRVNTRFCLPFPPSQENSAFN